MSAIDLLCYNASVAVCVWFQFGTGEILIIVRRNSYRPVFTSNYTVTIPDSHIPGNQVVQVQATDSDVNAPFNIIK